MQQRGCPQHRQLHTSEYQSSPQNEAEDTLHAKDVSPLGLQKRTHPCIELALVKVSRNGDADRRNFFIMLVVRFVFPLV